MIIYRAMCPEEATETLKNQKPVFRKRFKWFSDDLSFIRDRVKDGRFAHSQFKIEPYFVILKFYVNQADFCEFQQLNKKELMLDVHRLPMVRFLKVEELSFQEFMPR